MGNLLNNKPSEEDRLGLILPKCLADKAYSWNFFCLSTQWQDLIQAKILLALFLKLQTFLMKLIIYVYDGGLLGHQPSSEKIPRNHHRCQERCSSLGPLKSFLLNK